MTRQESTRQRVPLRPIPALQWTGRNCLYHRRILITKHIIVIIVIFTKGPISWLLHVLIHPCSIIMIINNTDYLYSQHCHDHIDENQHDNLNRSSWSATYWWPGSFRECSRASDSQEEFQETIRWLSTMVKIRNYSQKFGEDVPENIPPPQACITMLFPETATGGVARQGRPQTRGGRLRPMISPSIGNEWPSGGMETQVSGPFISAWWLIRARLSPVVFSKQLY